MKRTLGWMLLVILVPALVWAQTYPTKVITIIVPFAAGGPTDTVTRLLAQSMGKTLGLLGFILGPMMEEYLRRAMLLSRGDPLVLVQRPISAIILGVAAVALLIVVTPAIRSRRKDAFQES